MKTGTSSRWVALAGLACVLGLSTATFGQGAQQSDKKNEPLHPPTPSKPDDPPIAMNYLAALLAVGLMGFAALIPSKRGHQD